MRHCQRRPAAGLTVIELLTLLAIIAIRVAILIPAIGGALNKAKRAVDANSLREIAKAAIIYASENNDRLPGVNIDATTFRSSGTGVKPPRIASGPPPWPAPARSKMPRAIFRRSTS